MPARRRGEADHDGEILVLEPETEEVSGFVLGGTPDPMGGEYPALAEQKPEPPALPENMAEDEDEMGYEVAGETEERRHAMRALYGEEFPLAADSLDEPDPYAWCDWVKALWDSLAPGTERVIHEAWANRLFRAGKQWFSSTSLREPPKPRDTVRAVHNMVAPALDQRVGVVTEQRPGFRANPVTQDPDDMKKAEAQQAALEYQYNEQDMGSVIREMAYWVGTDGVAFGMLHWDPDAGPWHEDTDADGRPYTAPLGDPRTRVYRIEQVRVSPNATATRRPHYWVVCESIPKGEAVALYGEDVVDASEGDGATAPGGSMFGSGPLPPIDVPGIADLHAQQDVVNRYYAFCEPTEYLPDGLTVVAVGDKTVYVGSLIAGVVPMFRMTDGSTDPSFYPNAIMCDWRDHQVRVNNLVSKWVESIRINSGGRFFMRANAVSNETLIGGLMSAIEVKSTGSINDAIKPVDGFSVGTDVMNAIDFEIKAFEQKSGWNDATRGSFANQQSGRAILAIREQLERVFAPAVNAAAAAMTQWGKITLQYMKWGYDIPRTIGVMGQSRVDLARQLSADDFDHVCDVWIDPETLMPMPRALKLFLLDQMYEKQQMTPQEYRRRIPFAWTRNLGTPDEAQEARGRRLAEAIRQQAPVPEMLWQDDEAIHQDILDREIILNDALPQAVRRVAQERWMALAGQAQQKQGGPPPQAMPQGDGPPQGDALPPGMQPFLGTSPGVASAPMRTLTGTQDEGAMMGNDYTQPY